MTAAVPSPQASTRSIKVDLWRGWSHRSLAIRGLSEDRRSSLRLDRQTSAERRTSMPNFGWTYARAGSARPVRCMLGRLEACRGADETAIPTSTVDSVSEQLTQRGVAAATAARCTCSVTSRPNPNGSMLRTAKPTTARRWPSPSRAACARSSPTATSASASSTGARASAPKAPEHLTIATTMYREMDMRFWLEQAQVESRALA